MKSKVRYLMHTFRKWNVAILAITMLGMTICCSSVFAQSGAGSIQGTVTDPSGAVIPGATIHVVNQATNTTADTRSNGVGFYQVPGLFAGTYTVTVSAPNMKTYIKPIQLLVNQAGIINAVMTAGSVTQQVEVAADMVQLTTTDSGTIGSTLESARLNQIPMNGHYVFTMVNMLSPGVENGRANGLLKEGLDWVADGVVLTDRQFGGENSYGAQLPDPDSVQEVRVESSNESAQYAMPGTVIITTKSGSNRLHGAAFETARNNAVGIAKARQNPSNYAAPHLVRNEFGASAGGPIILPKVYHGKDKSFWFFGYERYSLASTGSELVNSPTAAMRGGDWSGLVNAGVTSVLYDPNTTYNSGSNPCVGNGSNNAPNPYCRTPFPNNQIPIGRLSPTMKVIYDITPLPNLAGINPYIQSNLQTPAISNTIVPTITFRFDHNFNENNRAYLRYTQNTGTNLTMRNNPNSPVTLAADGIPAAASGLQEFPPATFGAAIGYTHVFSPTFFAETIVSQQWFGEFEWAGGATYSDYEKQLGLPNNFGEAGFPQFGTSGLMCPLVGTMFQYGLNQIVSTLDENLTKTVAKHQMQFGFRYRHERFGQMPDQNKDNVSFGSTGTGLYDTTTGASWGTVPYTGNSNGDSFLGAASVYQVNIQAPYVHSHDMEYDGYYQDNYHAMRNLTLNLGVRWEAHPAPWMKYGIMQAFDFKNDALVFDSTPAQLISAGYTSQAVLTNMANIHANIETAQQAGLPDKLVYGNNFTFSPRFGLAYQPFGGKHGTVLRAAYGRYIFAYPVRRTFKRILSNPPYAAAYEMMWGPASYSPDSLANPLLRVNGLPVIMGVNSGNNVVNTGTTTSLTPGVNLFTVNPNNAPDYVQEANFTIEQPFKGNSVLRLTYRYTHANNLDQELFYNVNPGSFAWEVENGSLPPQGGASTIGTNQYASTATNTYDNVTWGNNSIMDQKSGWSNDNALEANYERLYHHGVAYQISYVYSMPFRVAGNGFGDGFTDSNASYWTGTGASTFNITPGTVGTLGPYFLPPKRPSNVPVYGYWHDMDRWQNYILDNALPRHHVRVNGLYDLPLGTGKRFLGNSKRWLNEIVGGFQIAGDMSSSSQSMTIAAESNTGGTPGLQWGPVNPIKLYKHNAKFTDCTSGVCYEAYEWFNGYQSPSVATSACVSGKCITGLPSGMLPYTQPIDTNYNPLTPGGKAQDANYNSNSLTINLLNGKTDKQGFGPSGALGSLASTSNFWKHTVLEGPFNWTADASVFKIFPITESTRLRVNVDAFNVLNEQGYNNPNVMSGEELMTSSYNTPRQLQFTMRLEF